MTSGWPERSTARRWIAACGSVIATAVSAAHGGVPALQINWSVNGGMINQALPPGVDNGDGSYGYEGQLVDDGTGLELTYNLTATPDSGLSGNVSLENDLQDPIVVSVDVILPTSEPRPEGSQLGGVVLVGLTTDPGGGVLASLPPFLWQTLVDGSAVGATTSLYGHPFFVAHSGPASSGVAAEFGTPDPVLGPPIKFSFGFALDFVLTPLDRASISSALITAGGPTPCDGDLNGDGVIGIADLFALLAAWGPCPGVPDPCPGDLDGDGMVGITDFLDLLAWWGPCA